ncbi:MAG: DNA cytosine methyltransferase, partial [Pelovirga sp.]
MEKRIITKTTVDTPVGTFIDLFCGCGGFTLGMMRAGYRCLAAIDFDPHAVGALRTNLKDVEHVLQRDLTSCSPEEIKQIIGTTAVDVIVGGPPCQGFSTARQRDGSNHGDRLKEDSRRLLYKEFIKFIEYFKPKVFVMENVLGIKSAAGGKYFANVQSDARSIGYCVHGRNFVRGWTILNHHNREVIEMDGHEWLVAAPQDVGNVIATRQTLLGLTHNFNEKNMAVVRALTDPDNGVG